MAVNGWPATSPVTVTGTSCPGWRTSKSACRPNLSDSSGTPSPLKSPIEALAVSGSTTPSSRQLESATWSGV